MGMSEKGRQADRAELTHYSRQDQPLRAGYRRCDARCKVPDSTSLCGLNEQLPRPADAHPGVPFAVVERLAEPELVAFDLRGADGFLDDRILADVIVLDALGTGLGSNVVREFLVGTLVRLFAGTGDDRIGRGCALDARLTIQKSGSERD